MYIESLLARRKSYAVKFVNVSRYEIVAWEGKNYLGTVAAVMTEREANQYIGKKVGGLSLVDGRVIDSQLANLYEQAGNSLAAIVESVK